MRRLTLIRHAITDWNASGRFQGAADVELNAEGEEQATRLREYVAGLEPDAVVYASPLARARRTAEVAFPDREIRFDPRLTEIDFGEFEGKTQAENLLHPGWSEWASDPYGLQAPGGESYSMLRTRAVAWMDEARDAGSDHVVAVTHSGTIQMLLAHVLGIEKIRWRKRIYLRHASVSRVLFRGDEVVVERVNDTRHLEAGDSDPFLD